MSRLVKRNRLSEVRLKHSVDTAHWIIPLSYQQEPQTLLHCYTLHRMQVYRWVKHSCITENTYCLFTTICQTKQPPTVDFPCYSVARQVVKLSQGMYSTYTHACWNVQLN